MTFVERHIGTTDSQKEEMLEYLGFSSMEELSRRAIPDSIFLNKDLDVGDSLSEHQAEQLIFDILDKNDIFKSFIGMGYYGTRLPNVVKRNILENPGWYTQYTPYQAEISQGRLEMLFNFQTMIADLTGLEVSNSSLLDESTAAAEAMIMSFNLQRKKNKKRYLVHDKCHPQTIELLKTRAEPLGILIDELNFDVDIKEIPSDVFGLILQTPDTEGTILNDYSELVKAVKDEKGIVTVATDLMALVLFNPPSEYGADIVVGNAQRFGVPLGYGGPHAAFFATKEKYKRKIPGRVVGLSVDSEGAPAYRLSLQSREQHIRRERATSNICTSQVLLAVISAAYAMYHGPKGLKNIAKKIHFLIDLLHGSLKKSGFKVESSIVFDTLKVYCDAEKIYKKAIDQKINLRKFDKFAIGVSFDELTEVKDVQELLSIFGINSDFDDLEKDFFEKTTTKSIESAKRSSVYLSNPVFNILHSEHNMLRYLKRLENKDLSLTSSMIPLGSCTMKLNPTSCMYPVTLAKNSNIHPFAPEPQVKGYKDLINWLERDLCALTGFDGCSLQPNAGSQGEYAGLLCIRDYHLSNGNKHKKVCLIPSSAHGTNPASAVMAGFKVKVVACDKHGNVDFEDLQDKCKKHGDEIGALMVTYPSTHGVFEHKIKDIADLIHSVGGQVYMDGANMNAQVGLCRPGDYGMDVCHLNLHKTFCIPHGGGGPGVGPICVAKHLKAFLPSHSVIKTGYRGKQVSSAPWGSASILCIPFLYIRMMGFSGLKKATQTAILNANYLMKKTQKAYKVLYKGKTGNVAHEFILDLRDIENDTGVNVTDIAKRLMDYGFHAPTVSFPVPGTVMIEPTESEDKVELDRFAEALISIRKEIDEINTGVMPKENNVLKNSPHTAISIASSNWDRPYTREKAFFPLAWVKERKFYPSVSRIDETFGDRNFICTCPPVESFDVKD